jgi:hypothetical protein
MNFSIPASENSLCEDLDMARTLEIFLAQNKHCGLN